MNRTSSNYELDRLFRAKTVKKESPWSTIIAWCLIPFIFGWSIVWENHVIVQWPVGYWQWVAISVPLMLFPKSIRTPIFGILFGTTALGQVLYWLGIVTLPLIHNKP